MKILNSYMRNIVSYSIHSFIQRDLPVDSVCITNRIDRGYIFRIYIHNDIAYRCLNKLDMTTSIYIIELK